MIFIFKYGGHVCLFLFRAQKTTLPLQKIGVVSHREELIQCLTPREGRVRH
jgi:hypothetical protein